MRNSGSSSTVALSASSTTRSIVPPRRLADRPHEMRKAVVGKHDVGIGRKPFRIARRHRGDALVAIGDDGALAARIDENRRQRGRQARRRVGRRCCRSLRAPEPPARGRRFRPCRQARRAGPRAAARPPRRATATAAFAAQPPLTAKNALASTLPSCAEIRRREKPRRAR